MLNNNAKKIFIGGFSQGCGMSLHLGYHLKLDLGGIISISGYCFATTKIDKESKIPLIIIHGLADKRRPWEEVSKTFINFD